MWLYSCNDVPAGFLYFKVISAGWCETASATSTYIIAVALCETVSLQASIHFKAIRCDRSILLLQHHARLCPCMADIYIHTSK